MAPKQTDPQFKLRLSPELKESLEEAAQRNNRSVSAEILARLSESFKYDRKDLLWDRRIEAIDRQLAEQKDQIDRLLKRPRD